MKTYAIKTISFILAALFLTACGGGGGEASAPEGSTPPESFPPSVEVDTHIEESLPETQVVQPQNDGSALAVDTTGDLVVDEDFLFKSNFEVRVDVSVSSDYDSLTVCKQSEAGKPDYARCLLRARLDEGAFNGQILATNDTDVLMISLWDFASPDFPQEQRWDLDLQGAHIQLN